MIQAAGLLKFLFNLQEILKHTPEDHPERLNLERAVEKMLEACSEVMDLIKPTFFFVTDAKAKLTQVLRHITIDQC
jgi:hypothetical protein